MRAGARSFTHAHAGEAHDMIRHFTDTRSCSCPDWLYRHRTPGNPCKHVKALTEAVDLLRRQRRHNDSVKTAKGSIHDYTHSH